MKILVIGRTGIIGRAVVTALAGHDLILASRPRLQHVVTSIVSSARFQAPC